jgi:hypothetical protein
VLIDPGIALVLEDRYETYIPLDSAKSFSSANEKLREPDKGNSQTRMIRITVSLQNGYRQA